MTLNEAIEHCKQKACGNSECALEHQQLADWLEELQNYQNKTNSGPVWRKIKDVTSKRTDEGDCVTTEPILLEGWMGEDDYRIIDANVMVNREMYAIPLSELKRIPKKLIKYE